MKCLFCELNNSLGGYSFGYTTDGKPGYKERGADTVVPFKSGINTSQVATANNATSIPATIGQKYVIFVSNVTGYSVSSITLTGAEKEYMSNTSVSATNNSRRVEANLVIATATASTINISVSYTAGGSHGTSYGIIYFPI